MALPPVFIGLKIVALLQGIIFIAWSAKDSATLKAHQATDCSIGSPVILLVYRLLNLAICLFIGIRQVLKLGPIVFNYFTVWNWWLLTLYFALAAVASARVVFNKRIKPTHRYNTRRSTGTSSTINNRQRYHNVPTDIPADWLERTVVTLYHVVTPMTWVIDSITWLVLAPTLMNDPDPVKVAHWRARLYDLNSYMQHGANAGMVGGEMLLNEMPGFFWHGGWLAMWGGLYLIWSAVFYIRNGKFIYPFLDVNKPNAWVGYVLLHLVHWGASVAFYWLVRLIKFLKMSLVNLPRAKMHAG